ncbi:hypothetical protein PJF56_18975 [Roseofilum sp. BLCC_M91]|uniref:Uncharacterized protein n=1 Tax=Roseofilum halophilum BLCC-M91 TaxID=3022259 RepID=A0ABT7BP21_9CYAN|nr:hypothetical protein [Roseofilum halophilum]MDJ1180946.1 hypothetical protein [Roseofilum halophilum BLCC-M91]
MSPSTVEIVVESDSDRSAPLAIKLKRTIQEISPKVEISIQSLESLNPLEGVMWCPLTLNIPDWLPFLGQKVYQYCRSLDILRQTVTNWGYKTGTGNHWLPLVLTAKGPLYGEAIENRNSSYHQPLHLDDKTRQTLYQLGYQLLRHIEAIPGVYLLQFGGISDPCFDRLIPFPDTPVLGSLGLQEPDLLTSYWYCQIGTPLIDLQIRSPSSSGIQSG